MKHIRAITAAFKETVESQRKSADTIFKEIIRSIVEVGMHMPHGGLTAHLEALLKKTSASEPAYKKWKSILYEDYKKMI